MKKDKTSFDSFAALDIRVGTVKSAVPLPDGRVPAWVMEVDFGQEIGVLKTSAQITHLYQKEELAGKQVVAIVNFPTKQIGKVVSECLVLGVPTGKGVVLLKTDQPVENGKRVS